ncbi:MAG TPA: hypothetical protein VM912_02930 [Terriglobales bacterium]|nr:hypothetical protein [Terriglobales bacterium]
MNARRGVLHICAFVLIPIWAPASAQQRAADRRSHEPISTNVNACALLTGNDIQTVQGERLVETKPTSQPSAGAVFYECVYRTKTASKSVSLAVAVPAAHSPSNSAQNLWRQQFHPAESSREAGEHEGEKARLISGLGDEAFWINTPVTGALYVLRGNTFFRISVGGIRKEAERLSKSRALAEEIVSRLNRTTAR